MVNIEYSLPPPPCWFFWASHIHGARATPYDQISRGMSEPSVAELTKSHIIQTHQTVISTIVYKILREPKNIPKSFLPFSIAIAAGAAKSRDGMRAMDIAKLETTIKRIPLKISPHSPKIANHMPEIIPPSKFKIIIGTVSAVSVAMKPVCIFSDIAILILIILLNHQRSR